MHNRLMSNVGPFFSPLDLSQFWHEGFVLVNKHCPVFFFRWFALRFQEIKCAKNSVLIS